MNSNVEDTLFVRVNINSAALFLLAAYLFYIGVI